MAGAATSNGDGFMTQVRATGRGLRCSRHAMTVAVLTDSVAYKLIRRS